MLARVASCVFTGLQGTIVEVEVDVASGLPAFDIVGLPDAAVRESRERVRAAVRNAGLDFPVRRITVNLAPADLRKEGPHLDLPIAVGVLAASGQVPAGRCQGFVFAGHLSLDGAIGPMAGALPLALCARQAGFRGAVVPRGNGAEAALAGGLEVVGVAHLREVAAWLRGETWTPAPVAAAPRAPRGVEAVDLAEVRGQTHARLGLEVAAAGGHNLLLMGPPGAGKTMLARALPGILPPLGRDEALEVTAIYSSAGLLPPGAGLLVARPFRAPHHSASVAALVGGGPRLRPGEVTLAHRGVLFLDEVTEFARDALEALRQPLEDGRVYVARARGAAVYPARFTLVAAGNPCPCGFHGDGEGRCVCTPAQVRRYRQRLSGPLLDRLDLHVYVRRLEAGQLLGGEGGEPSSVVRARVAEARERQAHRFRGEPVTCNAEMTRRHVRRFCRLDPEVEGWLQTAYRNLGLNPRGLERLVKVARTLADLRGEDEVGLEHLNLALSLRQLDRYAQ